MRIRSILRGMAFTFVSSAFTLVLSTCGGQPDGLVNRQAADNPPVEAPLHDALDEIDALETPEGVGPALFQQLKDELAKQLSAKGVGKIVSTPPTGEANRVDDLELTDDGGTYALTWHYKNLGDYDQNGTVGIADITPLAMHYSGIYDVEDVNCLLAVVDGSDNQVVDIADITPIAMNYGVDCAHYRLEEGDSAEGEFTLVQQVPLMQATGDGRLAFSVEDLSSVVQPYLRVVPYDGEGAPGVASEPVLYVAEPPEILSVSPTSGLEGESIEFSAEVESGVTVTYAWDFGGGADPNTSSQSSPTVTLGAVGEYPASLTASNAFGDDEFPFTLTVNLAPPQPPTNVQATDGDYPDRIEITWTASSGADSYLIYRATSEDGTYNLLASPADPFYNDDPGDANTYWYKAKAHNDIGDSDYSTADSGYKGSWHISTADSVGDVGTHTSLAVVDGSPAISYYDNTNDDLKYVRATDASGGSWGTPATVDSAGLVGRYNSLAVVNGNPAISYYRFDTSELIYARADDASGGSWGAPVTVDSTGLVGEYTSLAVVTGNPAISYYDEVLGNLKYIRASDGVGASWGAPVTPDSAGEVGKYTSLAVVNGNPAISYLDETNYDLKYVRANDDSGANWGTPQTVDFTGQVGHFTFLVVVNGNPAISYYDWTNDDLRYVRADDDSGASWGTPAILDSTGNVGEYNSLAVVNGNPAISYFDRTNADLKYVRANDATGASWGAPLTLDSVGDLGWYTSLVSRRRRVFCGKL